MSERSHFKETGTPYLELDEKDKERLEKISEMLKFQDEAIEKDRYFRESVQIDEETIGKIFSDAEAYLNMEKPKSILPRFWTPEARRKQQEEDEKLVNYYSQIIANICNTSGFDSETTIATLEEQYALCEVGKRIDRYVGQQSENNARELLSQLEQASFETCDASFTTSQENAVGSDKRKRQDPTYDSIYYLYRLSNGTFASQRFKRNIVDSVPLRRVVQPVMDLALFFKGTGNNSKRSLYDEGFHEEEELSCNPTEGHTLIEFYNKSTFHDRVMQDDIENVQIPDVISPVDGGGVIIAPEFGTSFKNEHLGTRVNSILKTYEE